MGNGRTWNFQKQMGKTKKRKGFMNTPTKSKISNLESLQDKKNKRI